MFTEELAADAPAQEPDFQQLLPNCDGAEICAIQAWYAADFDRRVTELSELLRIEITEQLRAQFNEELEQRVAFAQSKQSAGSGQNADTQGLLEEIASAQEDLQKKEAELANKMTADAFPFADVLRLRTEKSELAAYLRGLNFRASAVGVQ